MVKVVRTKPEVFIVESLTFDNEEAGSFDGRILEEMLRLGGKKPRYYYVRTKREFEAVLVRFKRSRYRYLHLSCHGSSKSLEMTLDSVDFPELATLLNPYLEGRRLFISACDAVNDRLARAVMPTSGCLSIIGHPKEVHFAEAATMWASFYHLAFRANRRGMKRRDIEHILEDMARSSGYQLRTVSGASLPRDTGSRSSKQTLSS